MYKDTLSKSLPPPARLPSGSLNPSNTFIVPSRKVLRHYPQVKLKNLQWHKLDAKSAEQTIWHAKNQENHDTLEKILNEKGAFEMIENLFPAKVNTFLEKRLQQQKKLVVQTDTVRFLSKEKNKNISKYPMK
jgi:arginine deiminase